MYLDIVSEDEIYETASDPSEDGVLDQLGQLEKNHKTKCLMNEHETAYLLTDKSNVTLSVYDKSKDTTTEYQGLSRNAISEEVAVSDSPYAHSGHLDDDLDEDTRRYTYYYHTPLRGAKQKVVRRFHKLSEVVESSPGILLVRFEHRFEHFCFLLAEGHAHSVNVRVFNHLRDLSGRLCYSQKMNGLSKMRSKGEFDFTLVSKEGSIPIHSVVFKACLPFFAMMMESKMRESHEKKMEIPYPHSWVEAMVSYFYGELSDMKFEQATGLLILADVYDIPELRQLSINRIKSEKLDMTKCLAGWKNAFEAQNEETRAYFASFARHHWDQLEESAELLHEMSQQEAVELMLDVSKAKVDKLDLEE